MPKKPPTEKHVERWHGNRNYAARCQECDCDWLVTSLFYGVLHGTQALLVRSGYNPQTHTERNANIRALANRNLLSRGFIRQYTLLREASNHARYAPENTKYQTYKGVQEEIIDLLVVPLEEELKRKLTPSLVGPLSSISLQPT